MKLHYEDPFLIAAKAFDEAEPGRVCAWCGCPRNSVECQFAANHTPYFEAFA